MKAARIEPSTNIVPLLAPRSPAGAAPLPSDISHQAAQAELDAAIFPHYLLGRQLALEEALREVMLTIEPATRAAIVDKLKFQADQAIQRLQTGITDPHDDAATCGYVCALLQQGA